MSLYLFNPPDHLLKRHRVSGGQQEQTVQLHVASTPHKHDIRNQFYLDVVQSEQDINRMCGSFISKRKSQNQAELESLRQREQQQKLLIQQFEADLQQERLWDDFIANLLAYFTNHQSANVRILSDIVTNEMQGESKKAVAKSKLIETFESQMVHSRHALPVAVFEDLLQLIQSNGYGSHVKLLTTAIAESKDVERRLQAMCQQLQTGMSSAAAVSDYASAAQQLESDKQLIEELLQHRRACHVAQSPIIQDAKQCLLKCDQFVDELHMKHMISKSTSSMLRQFPYIAIAEASSASIKSSVTIDQLPAEIKHSWQELQGGISHPAQFFQDPADGSQAVIALHKVTKYAVKLTQCLQAIHKVDKQLFATLFIDHVLQSAKDHPDDGKHTTFLAVLVFAVYRHLLTKQREAFSKILKARFCKYSLLIPNLIMKESLLNPPMSEQLAMLKLFSCIVGYASDNTELTGPLDMKFAWTWLIRFLQQMHHHNQRLLNPAVPAAEGIASAVESISANTSCCLLYDFLQYTGYAFYLHYQSKFTEVLRGAVEILAAIPNQGDSCPWKAAVQDLLQRGIAEGMLEPIYYNYQEPVVVENTLLASASEVTGEDFEVVSKDRNSPFMVKVKANGIDRMRAAFNKLSATVESQHVALADLRKNIVIASQDSGELLRYTLYKIVENILNFCQEESFSELRESQPTQLARICSILCMEIDELNRLIRSMFVKACPPLMPKIFPEGLTTEEFFKSIGFKFKALKGSNELAPEKQTAWITRMCKIASVVAATAIQPEQTPFTIADIWLWLTRTMNSVARLPSPPFYLGALLNVILKICGPKLLETYREKYMKLVIHLNDQLLPKLEEDASKSRLKDYFSAFISSKGSNSIKLFTSS